MAPRSGPVIVAMRRTGPLTASALGALSPTEHEQRAAMGPRRAADFGHGRVLLRWLAGRVLGIPARQVPLSGQPGQRPYLQGRPDGVSLSHTTRTVAAAIWPGGEVGIDAEEPPAVVPAALIRRCCGTWAAALGALPERSRSALFAHVWTVQEACVKARGLGLAGAPWRIAVDPLARDGQWQELRWTTVDLLAPTAIAVAVRIPG